MRIITIIYHYFGFFFAGPRIKRSFQSESQRAKARREKIKQDPKLYKIWRQKENERNKRNRQRPQTEEEKKRMRELSRIRMQKSRLVISINSLENLLAN